MKRAGTGKERKEDEKGRFRDQDIRTEDTDI